MTDKPRDISDITKEEGLDAARAYMDDAQPAPKPTNGGADDPPAIFKPTPFVWRDPADIKRRSWLYGMHYQRGYVGVTVGRRGYGKTARVIVEMLSMVTGRDLLKVGNMPDRPQRVWYLGEDPREEIERRIVAACAHYGIKPEEIGDRLSFDSVLDLPRGATKVATVKGNAVVANEAAINALKAGIEARQVDVLVLDPLKRFHGVQENVNDQMDDVMAILSEIAMAKGVAIEILHHTRKPSMGNSGVAMTVDDGR